MKRVLYTKVIFIVSITIFLSGCGGLIKTSENHTINTNQIKNNQLFKKYNEITYSGNLLEGFELNLDRKTKNTVINMNINSDIFKNLNQNTQTGRYLFVFQKENKAFQEETIISGIINMVSSGSDYFLNPQNIYFQGPKGKYSNKDLEEKLSGVNNKRIYLDKETPFKKTSITLLQIQQSLKNLQYINISSLSGKIFFNSKDQIISGYILGNTGFIFCPQGQKIYITKNKHQLNITISGKESDIYLHVKIQKRRNSIIFKFKGNVVYNNLNEIQPEIKLDIKGKYIIKDTGYVPVKIPKDYLNFTETSLIKK